MIPATVDIVTRNIRSFKRWLHLGMGAVSSAMAKSAVEKGAAIFTDQVS